MADEWREALPVYRSDALTLREVEDADAAPLAHHLSSEEVTRFISPPPRTLVSALVRCWAKRRVLSSIAAIAVPNARNHGSFSV